MTVRSAILMQAALLALGLGACAQAQQAQQPQQQGNARDMTFFVTSANPGRGADFGGLAGADAHCQALAQAVGAGSHRWRAYLSDSARGNSPAVNARDRIGRGPWRNIRGEVIAQDVAQLHGQNNLTKLTALTEKGQMVNGVGDTPNMHDILTGTQPDGTAFAGNEDRTCRNWTYGGAEGAAMVGHSDRRGIPESPAAHSWNSAHLTRGCSMDALRSTGGAGLLYCFAAD